MEGVVKFHLAYQYFLVLDAAQSRVHLHPPPLLDPPLGMILYSAFDKGSLEHIPCALCSHFDQHIIVTLHCCYDPLSGYRTKKTAAMAHLRNSFENRSIGQVGVVVCLKNDRNGRGF